MDCEKTGKLIRRLRQEKGYTQAGLADRLHVSDKAVSKWERGLGCPDISLLPQLSALLGAELESLIIGDMTPKDANGGNMKKLKFYVCPDCGNIITAEAEASISCCGKKLLPIEAAKAAEGDKLNMERIENDWYITSGHPMEKEHFIAFAAIVTGDGIFMKRLYPEWDMQTRLPWLAHGKLVWYCTQHGLYYQLF
ncbi:MAG: helix-turn-helix domain-containing protein [Clostridiales bacterium]|nr:helix-turn-helix domain-containing protein [Clostridiales bacterium]